MTKLPHLHRKKPPFTYQAQKSFKTQPFAHISHTEPFQAEKNSRKIAKKNTKKRQTHQNLIYSAFPQNQTQVSTIHIFFLQKLLGISSSSGRRKALKLTALEGIKDRVGAHYHQSLDLITILPLP